MKGEGKTEPDSFSTFCQKTAKNFLGICLLSPVKSVDETKKICYNTIGERMISYQHHRKEGLSEC